MWQKVEVELHSDFTSHAEAQGRICGDVLQTDLIPVQTQHPQFGEVHHVHDTAETPQRKLCV